MAKFNLKKFGRKVYKRTGYKNPMKKGVLSTTRIIKQLPKLAKDVMYLKSMINAEKKTYAISSATFEVFGQIAGNASGHFLMDISPKPLQGTGHSEKTGNSIKLHSSHMMFQFAGLTNCVSGYTAKIQLIKVIGEPYITPSDIMGEFISANLFIAGTNIYDNVSQRDPDYFKNFMVLKTKYVKLRADQITGDVQSKVVNIGMKYKDYHFKTDNDTTTMSSGQLLLLITADTGNASNATAWSGSSAVFNGGTYTGGSLRYQIQHYFYDN